MQIRARNERGLSESVQWAVLWPALMLLTLGIIQAGTVGYWIGQPFARHGYMTRALRVLLPYTFDELSLHRVEAACIPTNEPSNRLLQRCGFVREGLARRYLCIAGQWQDHYLYGLLRDDLNRPYAG